MSPIKGYTDQKMMAFPKIGNIRKGEPKGKSKFPQDLDYFRVEFDEHEIKAGEIFLREYGPEPKEILIWLPYKEIDDCWEAWLEGYTAGALQARSDGEIYIFLREPDTGEVLIRDGIDIKTGVPRLYDPDEPAVYYKDTKGKKQPLFLKQHGRLEVIIPVLERLASLTLHTSSKNDILEISKNLQALYFVNSGSLQSIDILLTRKPRMISTPGESGKRVRREKNLIFLETAPTWVQKQVNGLRMRAELQPVEIAGELEAGIDADEITGEVIDAETGEIVEKADTPKASTIKPWPPKAVERLLSVTELISEEAANELLDKSGLSRKATLAAIGEWGGSYAAAIVRGDYIQKAIDHTDKYWKDFGKVKKNE